MKNIDILLKTENLSLEIPLVNRTDQSLKRTFVRSITGGKIAKKNGATVIKALSNLNLTIKSGEKVALIGHNGAGKSSFIKLISGIYEQTSGYFYCPVKAFPMLQKSCIVSDSLTGVDEAKARYLLIKNNLKDFRYFLEDIKNFSGLGDYISLPLRTYSSGMISRLIFSILTYHAHQFLALDEVIGTGDADFYKKAEYFINLSDSEGMSNSLIEAMSYGCKCIVTKILENIHTAENYAIYYEEGEDFNHKITESIKLIPKEISKYANSKYSVELFDSNKLRELYKVDNSNFSCWKR